MSEPPLVSTVIPTFNRCEKLPVAAASVIAQTYRPLELVISDDGSTDDTPRVAESIRQDAEAAGVGFQYIRAENGGVSQARNLGTEAATGEYLGYLDDDDEWKPTKVARQVERLLETGASAVCSITEYETQDGLVLRPVRPQVLLEGLAGPDFVAARAFTHINTVLFRRDLWGEVGPFDRSLPTSQDVEWLTRLAFKAEFCAVQEPLVRYRDNPEGISKAHALAAQIKLDLERLTVQEMAHDQFHAHPQWDQAGWVKRYAVDGARFVGRLVRLNELERAAELLRRIESRAGKGHPALKKVRRKLRKRRILAMLGYTPRVES
jgi:glycosyltransferase involved in cell wall biosynthesis